MKYLVIVLALLFASSSKAEVIGGRPAGCPTLFCGCGAALEVFGHHVRDLWQARAWYRFERSAPGYNTVAVRRHHVFVLKEHRRGDVWLVKDYNSGGRKTRLHERSIAGYTIVNPSGGFNATQREATTRHHHRHTQRADYFDRPAHRSVRGRYGKEHRISSGAAQLDSFVHPSGV